MSENQETLIYISEGESLSSKKNLGKTLADLRAYKNIKFAANRTATIIAVGVFLLILSAIPILNKRQQLTHYREQYKEASEQLATLRQDENYLEYEVNLLKDDEYIAKLVRDEYGFSKENELVFKFPSDQASEATQESEN